MSSNELFLIKNTSEQHATYQIRLLAFFAVRDNKTLIVDVPKKCKIHNDLRELVRQYPKNVTIERA